MARLPRVYIEGALYYITSRSGHNENLFLDPDDYKEYISLIAKYKQQYGFKLYSYVLLPDHLHMLIELRNNIGISNIMHDITSLYTKVYNNRYGKKGHLFQQRFRAVLLEKKPYLLESIRHTHLNPVRLRIVSDPKDYSYSSHIKYLNASERERPDIKSEVEDVFAALGGAETAFDEYVKSQDQKQINEFKKMVRKKRILGTEAFADSVKKQIEENARQRTDAPLSRRKRLLFIILLVTFLYAISTAIHYYRQANALKSEYTKTLTLYEKTLDVLRRGRQVALGQNKDVEDYEWKIGLAEKALEDLKDKRNNSQELADNFEGYAWEIKINQTQGPRTGFPLVDIVYFRNNQVILKNMSNQGFRSSKYSTRLLKNGNVAWETMQTNRGGDTISWHGEWGGHIMKGVFSKRLVDGEVSDFSFVSSGDRIKL